MGPAKDETRGGGEWLRRAAVDQDRALSYAREVLRLKMREISEDGYCAGWMGGLEYMLWRIAENPDRRRFGMLDNVDGVVLKQLADDAEGWWHWPEGGNGEQFIPMAEWLVLYGEWCNDG